MRYVQFSFPSISLLAATDRLQIQNATFESTKDIFDDIPGMTEAQFEFSKQLYLSEARATFYSPEILGKLQDDLYDELQVYLSKYIGYAPLEPKLRTPSRLGQVPRDVRPRHSRGRSLSWYEARHIGSGHAGGERAHNLPRAA